MQTAAFIAALATVGRSSGSARQHMHPRIHNSRTQQWKRMEHMQSSTCIVAITTAEQQHQGNVAPYCLKADSSSVIASRTVSHTCLCFGCSCCNHCSQGNTSLVCLLLQLCCWCPCTVAACRTAIVAAFCDALAPLQPSQSPAIASTAAHC